MSCICGYLHFTRDLQYEFFICRNIFYNSSYIKDNLEEYYAARRFAPFLGEIGKIHKYFLKAAESDIDNFRHIIRLVYLQISNINTILETDVEYLEQLLAIVKEKVEDKKNGAIMNFNINCLQKDLELAIKALKGERE